MSNEAPVEIGTRRELFVDEALLERRAGGAALRLHHPRPQEVVLVTDQPWEGNVCGQISVVEDGPLARMYYKAHDIDPTGSTRQGDTRDGFPSQDTHPIGIACAESRDGGRTWERPDLGIVEFRGSRENNLVWMQPRPGLDVVGRLRPFKDTNPDAAPEARYKALGKPRQAYRAKVLFALHSPDGVHFRLTRDDPVMRGCNFDNPQVAFWDPNIGKYRAYVRHHSEHGRDIFHATSDDFLHWTEPQVIEYPGAISTQLYTSNIVPYYRAPHLYVGFPTRYVQREYTPVIEALPDQENRRRRASRNERLGSALTDNLFMSSRDGTTWNRWDEAFLRPGPERPGTWSYGDTYVGWGMLETPAALPGAAPELSLFATENYWHGPGTRFRRYTLRLDGFVSLQAPRRGGEALTRPLTFRGRRLLLNMSTSVADGIRVEIQDPAGRPLPGFELDACWPVVGDAIERPVRWRNDPDLGALAGRPVRLRFAVSDADLYAFRFADAGAEGPPARG